MALAWCRTDIDAPEHVVVALLEYSVLSGDKDLAVENGYVEHLFIKLLIHAELVYLVSHAHPFMIFFQAAAIWQRLVALQMQATVLFGISIILQISP